MEHSTKAGARASLSLVVICSARLVARRLAGARCTTPRSRAVRTDGRRGEPRFYAGLAHRRREDEPPARRACPARAAGFRRRLFAPRAAASGLYQKGDVGRRRCGWPGDRGSLAARRPRMDCAEIGPASRFCAGSPPSAPPIPIGPPETGSALARRRRSTARARAPRLSRRFFAQAPPRTAVGKLALARVALDAGRRDLASALVRGRLAQRRFRRLDGGGAAHANFPACCCRADHKYRTERLLYAEKIAPALRAAALAGADELESRQSLGGRHRRACAGSEPGRLACADQKRPPRRCFCASQSLRRADRVLEAALLLRSLARRAPPRSDRRRPLVGASGG